MMGMMGFGLLDDGSAGFRMGLVGFRVDGCKIGANIHDANPYSHLIPIFAGYTSLHPSSHRIPRIPINTPPKPSILDVRLRIIKMKVRS